jgi:hypothetical protein
VHPSRWRQRRTRVPRDERVKRVEDFACLRYYKQKGSGAGAAHIERLKQTKVGLLIHTSGEPAQGGAATPGSTCSTTRVPPVGDGERCEWAASCITQGAPCGDGIGGASRVFEGWKGPGVQLTESEVLWPPVGCLGVSHSPHSLLAPSNEAWGRTEDGILSTASRISWTVSRRSQ